MLSDEPDIVSETPISIERCGVTFWYIVRDCRLLHRFDGPATIGKRSTQWFFYNQRIPAKMVKTKWFSEHKSRIAALCSQCEGNTFRMIEEFLAEQDAGHSIKDFFNCNDSIALFRLKYC